MKDNTGVIITPFCPNDVDAVCKFFSGIPKSDLLVYKDDVDKRSNFEDWFVDSSHSKVLHLIGWVKDNVVANGTLHSEGLYWSHAVELKLIVDPRYRNKSLGSQIFNILLCEVLERDFQKVIVRYFQDNIGFTKIIDQYGFHPETVLSSYVEDEVTGVSKDLIIASFSFDNWSRRFEFYSFIYR